MRELAGTGIVPSSWASKKPEPVPEESSVTASFKIKISPEVREACEPVGIVAEGVPVNTALTFDFTPRFRKIPNIEQRLSSWEPVAWNMSREAAKSTSTSSNSERVSALPPIICPCGVSGSVDSSSPKAARHSSSSFS